MRNKQDGRGKADYVQETEDEIRRLGRGGTGLHESLTDARDRGVTKALRQDDPTAGVRRPEDGRSREGKA